MALPDNDACTPRLGSGEQRLPDLAQLCRVSGQMTRQTRRTLLLLTQSMDPMVYDRREFLEPVKRLALRHGHLAVRVLYRDALPAVRCGHRLIALARRLPSRIELRQLPGEVEEVGPSLLIADESGFVRRSLDEHGPAIADFHAPSESRRLTAHFDRLWSLSAPNVETRQLHLGLDPRATPCSRHCPSSPAGTRPVELIND